MKKNPIENAFFNMDMIRQLVTMKSVDEAKKMAKETVEAKPNARQKNIDAAIKMIDKSRTVNQLAINCSDFLLAHDGKRVIR